MNAAPHSALRRQLCLAAPALLAAGALAGCSRQRAPYSTFTLLDGSAFYSSAFAGSVALVNFWATSCPYCMNEAPQLAALYQHYRPHGLQAVAVAMSYDRAGSLNRFMQTRQPPYPVAHDRDGSLARQWAMCAPRPRPLCWTAKGALPGALSARSCTRCRA